MVKLKIFETEIESITARDQFLRALGHHLEAPPPMDGFSQYTSKRMFEYDVTLQLGDPDHVQKYIVALIDLKPN